MQYTKKKKQLGELGETICQKYLMKKGWQVIAKNFRRWGGEIDLIARDIIQKEIVFVEVKTRRDIEWFDLDQTLSANQVRHIKRIAKRFMFEYHLEEQNWRIDHIAILLSKDNLVRRLEHFEAI